MRRLGISIVAGCVALGAVAASASADPLSYRQARKQLFKRSGYDVEILESNALDATMAGQIEGLAATLKDPQIALQMAQYGYYGAIAVVPDRPLSGETMTISARLHTPEAARMRALEGCNAARPEEAAECVAVALILPRGYKPRDLTLSEEASNTFRADWKEGAGPKVLAYSPASPAWVIVKGPGADQIALERCNQQAAEFDLADCIIAIADE